MRAVEECQVDVLEQVRSDVAGPVLLRFQEPDRSSGGRGPDIIRGVAVDMLDRDHRLSYRCEVDGNRATPSRVAYDFDDGRTRRQSQPAWEFPLASVQTCQDAVRQQVSRDRGRHDTVFESAGVSQWAGSLERVFGLGHERSVGGLTFEYRCDIQRGRVASADFLPIR
jgi:hypothetical protein